MSRAGQCWNLNSDPWKYHKVESGGYSGQAREVSCSGIPSWFVLPYESVSTRHCTSIMFCRMQWTTWRDFSSSVQPTKDVSEDSVLCSGSTATYENYYEEIKPAKGNTVGALLTLTHFDVAIIIFRWKKYPPREFLIISPATSSLFSVGTPSSQPTCANVSSWQLHVVVMMRWFHPEGRWAKSRICWSLRTGWSEQWDQQCLWIHGLEESFFSLSFNFFSLSC